ncbi:hypothetical protein ScPMuIL_014720 [Solemya velum]
MVAIIFLQYPTCHCVSGTTFVEELSRNVTAFNHHVCSSPLSSGDTLGHHSMGITCCQPCETDLGCEIYGTCCPEMAVNVQVLPIPTRYEKSCLYAHLRWKPGQNGVAFYMINKCPAEYKIGQMMERCEIEYGNLRPDITNILPVTSLRTNLTYRNAFCAICNNEFVADFLYWETELICNNVNNIFSGSRDLLMDNIYSKDCNIKFHPSVMETAILCDPDIISECNKTGQWRTYDRFMDMACHTFQSVFNKKYNNVYCYLCNEEGGLPITCDPTSEEEYPQIFTFSALLNFIPDSNMLIGTDTAGLDDEGCGNTQTYELYTGICRDLFCSSPRSLVGGRCTTLISAIEELSINVNMVLTSISVIWPDTSILHQGIIKRLITNELTKKGLTPCFIFISERWLHTAMNESGSIVLELHMVVNAATKMADEELYSAVVCRRCLPCTNEEIDNTLLRPGNKPSVVGN